MSTLAPPDPAWYAVEVNAGAYTWTVEKGDPASWGLADPLVVSWALPENGLVYPQPDPMRATFTLALAAMSDAADLDAGDPVSIFVTLDPATYGGDLNLVSFRGRVASLSMRPRKAGGVLVTVVCVDYTVDLAESPIGTGPWPAELVQARTDRMAAEAGVATPPTWPVTFGDWIPLAARTGALVDARSAFVRLVDTAGGGIGGGYKLYLMPNYPVDNLVDHAVDPLQPFDYWNELVTEESAGGQGNPYRLPGKLQLLSTGLYGIAIAEHAGAAGLAGILSAEYTDLGATWTLAKNDRPDTVVVTGPFATPSALDKVTATADDPVPITTVIDTDMTDWQPGQTLAALNLTTRDSDRWAFDEFVFFADLDPVRFTKRGWWFVDGAGMMQALNVPVVVSPIPEDQNPTGVDWIAGTPTAASLTIAGGRFSATVRLDRNLPRPSTQVGANIGYLDAEQLASYAPEGSLITNPGFEVNATGYTGVNATIARVTTQHHSGVGALSITATGANPTAVDSGSGVGGKPVVAGRAYRVPAWFKAAVTARICTLRVDWWNAAGVFLSQSVGPATVSDAAAGWTDFSQVFLAPAGAAFARRQFIVAGAAVGEVHYLDDADMWRTLTPADLDPRFSAYDYRLVRNPNA